MSNRQNGSIIGSWVNRRAALMDLANRARDAESWTAAERAFTGAYRADLQIATLGQLAAAMAEPDDATRFRRLSELYAEIDDPKTAATYARLESELTAAREQREHERSLAELENVDDVPGAIRDALLELPAADLLALRDQVLALVEAIGG